MEKADWILVSKADESLYLKLTVDKAGRGKACHRWEWTEDFRECASFENLAAIDAAVKKHKIPVGGIKVRDYGRAHSTWLGRIALQTPPADV